MAFKAPAGIDDLVGSPDLQQQFADVWNDNSRGFLGRYVSDAASGSQNYVDPRTEAPATEPVAIPWNGFPRALSRWYNDELSVAAKEQAEATADVLTPILSWMEPVDGEPQLFSAEAHRVASFGERALSLARPLRRMQADGTIGSEVPQMRRQQDEYLEWHATRDGAGRLIALTFTAEPPDYWIALATVAKARVVQLYRHLVGPQVQEQDLFHSTDLAAFGVDRNGNQGWFNIGGKDEYDPLNPWTTTKGIVHLTHRANTLGAEVQLAADSSVVWASDRDAPPPAPDTPRPEIRRIACGGYGGVNRSSDPLIGQGVGGTVLQNVRVTLTDPIGLYIAHIGLNGLTGPQGQPVGMSAVEITRGTDDAFQPRMLRFNVKLPQGAPFRLDECKLEGRNLSRGGQVARMTTMQLYAQTYSGGANLDARNCAGRLCRHPDRPELFLIVGANRSCPRPDAVQWLEETPFEPRLADAFVVERAAAARTLASARVAGKVSVPAVTPLMTKRGPGKL